MLKRQFASIIAMVIVLGSGCTGKNPTAALTSIGSIQVAPGAEITVDLEDVVALNVGTFTVSLRSVSPDYATANILYDLTPNYTQSANPNQFSFIMPKSVTQAPPFLVVVDIPALNTQLVDLLFARDTYTRPGIASNLTYTLLKYYPNQPLTFYTQTDFRGIETLIQQKVDSMLTESESLDLATTPYNTVMRYFINGLAFNPTFLTAITPFGINYGYTVTTPPGITAADTPEGSLTSYQYATNFTVNSTQAPFPPFNQTNNPPILLSGGSVPNPGLGLYVSEGKSVSVTAEGFDIDSDYLDRTMIVTYVPRVLPLVATSVPGFPFIPEHPSEYLTIPLQDNQFVPDQYTSPTIQFNEALDLVSYPTTLPFDASLYPNANQVDTAYQNVYYLISDGMVRIPYHWNFEYSDINRPPQIVYNANGSMDDTSLDGTIAAADPTNPYQFAGSTNATTWIEHGTHCQTNPTAAVTYPSSIYTVANYQDVNQKSDGPWSCVFKTTDPDIDVDPNGAPDQFYFSVAMSDNTTTVNFGLTQAQLWPVYIGPPYVANRDLGTTIQNCITPDGVTHSRCGQGLYQVVINNSVTAAAQAQQDSSYSYGVVVYDRPAAIGGSSTNATLTRAILIPPTPGLLVNFSQTTLPVLPSIQAPSATPYPNITSTCTAGPLDTCLTTTGGPQMYARSDIYLNELLAIANPGSSDLNTISLGSGFTSPLTASTNLTNTFASQTPAAPAPMSQYITQPFTITGNASTITWDTSNPDTPVATGVSPGTLTLLGHDMTTATAPTYALPREYDSSCQLTANNQDLTQGWSQTTSTGPVAITSPTPSTEGWSFEIDAIDYNNIGLSIGDVSDPVYFGITHDVNLALNKNGISFCNYNTPNANPLYYETYQAVGSLPAVNAESCRWLPSPPAQMQPFPVYYQVTSPTGVVSVKKFVYHRLRFLWQPKDQGVNELPGFVQNTFFSAINGVTFGPQIFGNAYQTLQNRLDLNLLPQAIKLLAIRKDMAPCLTSDTGNPTLYMDGGLTGSIEQQNTSLGVLRLIFGVLDENKVLNNFPTHTGAIRGRYEAEITLLGSNSIVSSTEFLKYIPYAENCSLVDAAPAVPSTTPIVTVSAGTTTGNPVAVPPSKLLADPVIWYSQASDNNNTPRVRFQSETNALPINNSGDFCMDLSYTPLKNSSGTRYNEVILIQNSANSTAAPASTPYSISFASGSPLFNCTSIKAGNLGIDPDQGYIALASTCGLDGSGNPAHTVGQTLWSNSTSTATVAYILDPQAIGTGAYLYNNGGYAKGTVMNLKMFPSMYQADISTNYNAANELYFNAVAIDNFQLSSTTGLPFYTGYVDTNNNPVWLSNNAPAAFPATSPFPVPRYNAFPNAVTYPSPYAYNLQVLDWDNQPITSIPIATPTPPYSNVFFRLAPGSSNSIQVFVKNNATVAFPIQVSDTTVGAKNDIDAFDVMEFNLVPPLTGATPYALPTFTGAGPRSSCTSAPSNAPYNGTDPALSAITVNTILPYKQCTLTWSPTVSDNGQIYNYTYQVQDNFATWWNLVTGMVSPMGIGARHPAALYNVFVPGDSGAITNGPDVTFYLTLQAIENNTHPFFTTALSSPTPAPVITTLYGQPTPTPSSGGWVSVFPASGGSVSPCASPVGVNQGLFPCATATQGSEPLIGDVLQSATVTAMTEGTQQGFTVYAQDTSVTTQFRTLTASKPTKVLIIDGPHGGRNYTVPSFSTMTLSTTQNVTNGTSTFSFSWTPTDSEANYLSNPGGFLIPLTVSNQPYVPAGDSGFPPSFDVPALSSTIWIWANLSVLNMQPSLYYVLSGSNTEVPLAGATIQLQTGTPTPFTIRLKDPNTARWCQSDDYNGYSESFTALGTTFTSVAAYPTPYASPACPNANYIIQDFIVTGNPTTTQIGTYTTPLVSATDPGSDSLGLAINPDTNTPPNAKVFSGATQQFSVPFNLQVIGQPYFTAPGPNPSPAATPAQVYAYATKSFYYPLSLFVSRPTEKLQPFFIGIDESTATTPIQTTSGSNPTGIYVNQNSVLRWQNSTSTEVTGAGRTIPLYGILASYCNVGSPFVKTLVSFNDSTNTISTCNLTQANITTNAAIASVTINLESLATLSPSPPPITQAEVDRSYNPAPTPGNLTLAIDEQFSDFYGRCAHCVVVPTTNNTTPAQNQNVAAYDTDSTGPTKTAYQLNAVLGLNNVYAKYSTNSYVSEIVVNNAAGFQVNKVYKDMAPSTLRSLNVSAFKGESLTLQATIGGSFAVPYYQYRWYVNGCVVSTGMVTSATVQYNLTVGTLMGGINNDCTGAYGFSETNGGALGKLVVRLDIVNGDEVLTSGSEGASSYYLWNITILNTSPTVVTGNTYSPSNPIVLNSTYMSGNSNVQYAIPVSFSGNNYLAYTDLNTSTGMYVRLKEINATGSALPSPSPFSIAGNLSTTNAMTLNCGAGFKNQPVWMGIQNEDGTLRIAASNMGLSSYNGTITYPTGASALYAYGTSSETCLTETLTTTANNLTATNYGGSSTVPAPFLPFSTMSLANDPTASFSITASLYDPNSNNAASFFLLDGASATSQFWTYLMASIYSSTPTALGSGYPNNAVRRNIIYKSGSNSTLFQLIGAPSSGAAGTQGFIITSSLAQHNTNQVLATPISTLSFSSTASSPNCTFNGTPLDGVYVSSMDTLFVLAEGADGNGRLVAINNATTASASCNVLNNVATNPLLNPSLLVSSHNPNISKMAYDSTNGMIYGIINTGVGISGEFYAYDIYSQQLSPQVISSTISPYEVLFIPGVDALYLFDNRYNTSPALTPTLYKIW